MCHSLHSPAAAGGGGGGGGLGLHSDFRGRLRKLNITLYWITRRLRAVNSESC